STARNHMGWRICWPRNDSRHNGRVRHSQARDPMHAKLWIDDGQAIYAHLARADAMPKAFRAKPGKVPDVFGGRLRAGHDFDLAYAVKSRLISQFTRDL